MAVTVESVTPDSSRTTAIAKVVSDRKGADAITELQGMEPKHAAIAAAQGLLADPRVSGEAKIVPTDAAGNIVEDPVKQTTTGYYAEIPLSKKLV